jgi:uracil-DNA glycosylase family 4
MNNKQTELDKIKADIIKDNVCPELAKTATNLVFGDGNPDADIIFIGEAPGKNEDEQGLPFVGAAGKFLDEMLTSINLKRAQVYITNIVKYRPPNNRDPELEEKAAFFPYLEKQIEVIRPLLIVPLGRHSMTCFLPHMLISQIHGQPKRLKYVVGRYGASTMQGADENRSEPYEEYGEREPESATQQRAAKHGGVLSSAQKQAVRSVVILPLYHPAAALYNGAMRQTLIDDFSRIPEIINLIRQAK